MRIAHVADIHIRGRSRLDENKLVFTEFAEKCKAQLVDHIFVGGDVFHTKTLGITAEYIDFMVWWLTTLADVAPVHIILGNHDLNEANLNRQDAVSPVVNAINNPRVFLYKYSGVYQFAPGYNWCVFGIVDEENWDKVKPVAGEFNIACYHGSVFGSKTESDWELKDGLPVEFFEDYDMCLLGDIHKTQFLGYKDVELEIEEADLSRYPGAEIVST